MSIRATTWAWEVSARVPDPYALLVLLKLADMARDSGKAWPSHAYLAEKLPISPRKVRSSINYLEEVGLLKKEPREGKSDVLWLALSAVTIFAAGPEDDDELEGGKLRGRPRKTPAPQVATPDITPAPGADEPIEPGRTMVGDMRAPDPFEVWFKVYPRKQAKAEARKAFWKAATKIPFETLMTKTREFAASVVDKELEHIAHPATWLNGERWNDELPPHRSQTDGNSTRNAGGLDRGAATAAARREALVDGARQALDRRRRWTLGG